MCRKNCNLNLAPSWLFQKYLGPFTQAFIWEETKLFIWLLFTQKFLENFSISHQLQLLWGIIQIWWQFRQKSNYTQSKTFTKEQQIWVPKSILTTWHQITVSTLRLSASQDSKCAPSYTTVLRSGWWLRSGTWWELGYSAIDQETDKSYFT